MNGYLKLVIICCSSIVVTLVTGCVGDAIRSTKPLPGGYELELFEGNQYLLVSRDSVVETGGVLGGAVARIGWNERVIVAERGSAFLGGGGSAVFVIDLEKGVTTGPLTNHEFENTQLTDAKVRSIQLYPVAEAWKRL